MPEPLFEVSDLHKTFPALGDQPAREVLRGLDLTIAAGEVWALLGPSGAGKSTLLRMLNALDSPTRGTVRVAGRDVAEWSIPELRRTVAMLFQMPTMVAGTVRDNLCTPLRLRDGRAAAPDRAWVETLLASVGLGAADLDRPATTLSVGQQQRVAFARALVLRPRAILLDEPTASLDPTTAATFLDRLAGYSRELGLTVVLVTHQVDHARAIADRVALLVDGRLAAHDTRDAFFAATDGVVAQFLAGALGAPA